MIEDSRPVVLLTGASRGIGLAIATELLARGAQVVGTSRAPGPAPFAMVPLDVTDEASVRACVDAVLASHGRIDVLIANAGYDLYGAIEDTSFEEFHEQIDTNFLGIVRLVMAVLPQMRSQGSGRIVAMSSLGGMVGLPMNSAYAASKFALEGLCEALRLELAPSGILVSLVEPPAVATDTLDTSIRRVRGATSPLAGRTEAMVTMMREAGHTSPIRPEDVAREVSRIVFAARPKLRYPVGGQAAWLPRLKALLPQRWFERTLAKRFP